MKFRFIPIIGGFLAACCVLLAAWLLPYMPSQAQLAPEETALLVEWTKVGDALAVQRMVERGACVEAAAEDGTTALMIAAGEGHLEVVRVLLNHNARVNAANEAGDTPLHCAVLQNQSEIAAFLLEKGAAVDSRNKTGVTPLMIAAWSGFDGLVQMLLAAGADTELEDADGLKAATYARQVHDPATREVILKLLGA